MNGSDLQKIFSKNIYMARINLGYSQMKLAELADISTGFLCNIENGTKIGTFDTIAKIAAALKKEPYELFIPENLGKEEGISKKEKNDILTKLLKKLKENMNKTIQETINSFS